MQSLPETIVIYLIVKQESCRIVDEVYTLKQEHHYLF